MTLMSSNPICFKCVHFRQHQPLTFMTPGECGWQPKEAVPAWLWFYLSNTDKCYGAKREISTMPSFVIAVENCAAFEEKPDGH